MEGHPQWGLHFNHRFLFPPVDLNEILEIEYTLHYGANIQREFNKMDFLEFGWFYNRHHQQKRSEADEQSNQPGTLSTNALMRKMMTGNENA